MRKPVALLLLILSTATLSYSQSSSVKGTVADTLENKILKNTTISLLRRSDSVLVKFTRADKDGHFSIAGLKEGQYILMATHPYQGDYFDNIEVKAGVENDLGRIVLTPKSKLLAEVILKSGSPIRIKGDTTVYTADSFKVRPGANVEELLRRLPGIQVGKNGEIIAMGERVTKVLVDGEEFFGDDPGIATKNLRADAVKEVEVFDKKSDQAVFTGIDDGVKDKTINLKLKEDKKRGYFGKVEAGGGLKDKFNNDIMLNAFKGKRKIAAYGIMSNTGQTNLNWQDEQNYGGGDNSNMMMSDNGDMMMFFGGGDDSYRGGQSGIPTNWNGGLHFSNKYHDGKQNVNTGYRFSKVNAPGGSRTFSNTFLPDTSWFTNSTSRTWSSVFKHALNATYETNLDSMNSLKWTLKGNRNETRSNSDYYSESLDMQGDSINNVTRNNKSTSDNNSINTTLLWRHKFKKLSRTLSVNTNVVWSESKNDAFNYTLLNFFKGPVVSRDTTDQQNIRNNENKNFNSRVAYTEPLTKDSYLELNYQIAYTNTSNDRITRENDGSGKYSVIIDSLTNLFSFNRFVNTPGVNYRVNKKKLNYAFGTSVGFNHFVQNNKTKNQQYKYNFVNFFPQANAVYKLKPSESIRFNYYGSSTAPSLEQLQPTLDNTDQLNIYLGNPNLKPQFAHTVSLNYNMYNVLKERNIFLSVRFSTTHNAFVQYSYIDFNNNAGKRIYQTVNVNGGYSYGANMNYGFKIGDSRWRLNFSPNASFRKSIDFVNGIRNTNKNTQLGVFTGVSQYVENKYNFYIGPGLSHVRSRSSINSSANAEYWQLSGWANGEVTLLKTIDISSNMNYEWREKDPRFSQNNNYLMWNASVIKRIAKDKFELKFSVNDILDQNRGYSRNFNSYNFTESYFNTLRRFWLVAFTWNISKNGAPVKDF